MNTNICSISFHIMFIINDCEKSNGSSCSIQSLIRFYDTNLFALRTKEPQEAQLQLDFWILDLYNRLHSIAINLQPSMNLKWTIPNPWTGFVKFQHITISLPHISNQIGSSQSGWWFQLSTYLNHMSSSIGMMKFPINMET